MNTRIQINTLAVCLLMTFSLIATAEEIPIYDAHIHYSEDVWQALPAEKAIALLRAQGIKRALVSATPTQGAELLFKEDPALVVPMLRPYKNWRHRFTWFSDAGLIDYLKEHLQRVPYRGIGEFHVFSEDAAQQPVKDMIELAKANRLALHAHTDLRGIRLLLQQSSGLVLIWAHGGFDVPVETLRELILLHQNFYIELSYREGMLDEEGRLTSEWKAFLNQYPQRFLLGMDTYKPSRWASLPEQVAEARGWLLELPDAVAEDIARNNMDRLFPPGQTR